MCWQRKKNNIWSLKNHWNGKKNTKKINTALSGNLWLWQPCSNHNLLCFWNKSLDECFLNKIISDLRLQVTGLMNNADNPITTGCFFPICFPHIALYSLKSPIWPFQCHVHFSVFAIENFILWFSAYFLNMKAKIEAGRSQLTPLMQLKIRGAHSLRKNWHPFLHVVC